MSPMGTLVLGTNSKPPIQKVRSCSSSLTTNSSPSSSPPTSHHHNHSSNNNNANNNLNDHPLLKLMSVSLLNENSLSLNLHHSFALTLGKSNSKYSKMTLSKSTTTTDSSSSSSSIKLLQNYCPPETSSIGPDSTSSFNGPPKQQKQKQLQLSIDQDMGRKRFKSHHVVDDQDSNSISPSLESQNSGTFEETEENHHGSSMNDEDDEEDEVLSIGREDDDQQGMIINCDSSTIVSDYDDEHEFRSVSNRSGKKRRNKSSSVEEDDAESGKDDPRSSPNANNFISTTTTMFNHQSPLSFQYHKDSVNNYSSAHHHLPSSINECTSLPFSISEAIMMKSHHRRQQQSLCNLSSSQQQQLQLQQAQTFQQQQASLLFSIANILRPDFGLGAGAGTVTAKEPTKQSSLSHHKKSSGAEKRGSIPTAASGKIRQKVASTAGTGTRLHNLIDPLNPIDLSRPSLLLGSSQTQSQSLQHHRKNNNHKLSSTTSSNNHNRQQSHKSCLVDKVADGGHTQPEPNKQSSTIVKKTNKSLLSSPTTTKTTTTTSSSSSDAKNDSNPWPAWVYCTRYSDRPSSGPRTRRGRTITKKEKEIDEKRPRTAFTSEQLSRLKKEFDENRYLTEKRRQDLAKDLRLHENQIKIWFQNKRAKLKKSTGQRGGLALALLAQGLYNHSTIPRDDDDDYDDSD